MSRRFDDLQGDAIYILADIERPKALDSVALPPLTYVVWINPTGIGGFGGGEGRIFSRTGADLGHVLSLQDISGGQLNARVSRSTDAQAVMAFPASLFNNEWKFIAFTYKAGDGGPRLWFGTHAAAVAEASYVSRTDGSGAVHNVSSHTFFIGNDISLVKGFEGRIANVSVWSGVLLPHALDLLRRFPFAPGHNFNQGFFGDAVLFGFWPLSHMQPGLLVRDLSGYRQDSGFSVGTTVGLDPAREAFGSSGW